MNDRDNERIDLLDLPFDLEAALEALLFVSDEPVTALTGRGGPAPPLRFAS